MNNQMPGLQNTQNKEEVCPTQEAKKSYYQDTCCRERTLKEDLELKIKQHQEIVEGLQALYCNLPTKINERDDRSIRNALKLLN